MGFRRERWVRATTAHPFRSLNDWREMVCLSESAPVVANDMQDDFEHRTEWLSLIRHGLDSEFAAPLLTASLRTNTGIEGNSSELYIIASPVRLFLSSTGL